MKRSNLLLIILALLLCGGGAIDAAEPRIPPAPHSWSGSNVTWARYVAYTAITGRPRGAVLRDKLHLLRTGDIRDDAEYVTHDCPQLHRDRDFARDLADSAMGYGVCNDNSACMRRARAELAKHLRSHGVGWYARRQVIRAVDVEAAMQRHATAWRRVYGRATDCSGCKDGEIALRAKRDTSR